MVDLEYCAVPFLRNKNFAQFLFGSEVLSYVLRTSVANCFDKTIGMLVCFINLVQDDGRHDVSSTNESSDFAFRSKSHSSSFGGLGGQTCLHLLVPNTIQIGKFRRVPIYITCGKSSPSLTVYRKFLPLQELEIRALSKNASFLFLLPCSSTVSKQLGKLERMFSLKDTSEMIKRLVETYACARSR